MEHYNFWQDFFDTYQSLSEWMKTLWLVVPSAFLLGLIALILRYRIVCKRAENGITGDLVCTIHRDAHGQLHITLRGREIERESVLLPFG